MVGIVDSAVDVAGGVNLGRVTGRVVCDAPGRGARQLRAACSCSRSTRRGAARATPLVAADPLVRAAAGDVVWFVNGVDAVDAFDGPQPVDAVIVGMRDR